MYMAIIETNKLLHENESLMDQEITVEMVSRMGYVSEKEVLKVLEEKGAEDLEDLYFKTRDEVIKAKASKITEKINKYFEEQKNKKIV